MSTATDLELVDRARAGESQALEKLLSRHFDYVYSICRRVLRNNEDAADATQEAMMQIVTGLQNFSGDSAFTSWAYRVAFNTALRMFNKRKRQQDISDGTFAPEDVEPAAPVWVQPEHFVEKDEFEQAVVGLSDDHRIALLMHVMLQMSYEEIAQQLMVPVGTVRSRIGRARVALQESMESGG